MNRILDTQRALDQFAIWGVSHRLVVLDTETTGLGSDAEIVEVAAVDCHGDTLFESRVLPLRPIPLDASLVHGITDETVANCRTWKDVWPELEKALEGKRVVTYNASYDRRLVEQSCLAVGLPAPLLNWECVMLAFAAWAGEPGRYGDYRWQKLDVACELAGVDTALCGFAHSALGDALRTFHLIDALATRWDG